MGQNLDRPKQPGVSPSKEPDSEQPTCAEISITRRIFHKALAYLGIGIILNEAAGGPLEKKLASAISDDLEENIDGAARDIAEQVEKDMPEASILEKARKIVDYLGTFLFGLGIRSLMPGGKGHIDQAKYGALAALTLIKYQLEDEEGRHHLKEETKSNARAFVVINGTIAVAEGLVFDAEKAYENLKKRAPEDRDKIALMTCLASSLSPIATTVGSASVLRNLSGEFAAQHRGADKNVPLNTDMANVFVNHVSNLSGFLLFGDPPFIAICEKYGFANGLKWQLETMWPLALYSLLSATVKLNYQALKSRGEKEHLARRAVENAISGIAKNIPLLASILTRSLLNTARYFTPAGMAFPGQDQNGIEIKIGEILTDKLRNIARLPLDPALDRLTPEALEGITRDYHFKKEGAKEYVQGLLTELFSTQFQTSRQAKEVDPAAMPEVLMAAIREENWEKLAEFEAKIPDLKIFTKILKDFLDNEVLDHSPEEGFHESAQEKLKKMWARTFDVTRMGNALGHNMRDVMNVFPFQAGCVPFLVTVFKDGVEWLKNQGVSEKKQEIMLFFAIMMFSSVADNYVACKIGLELFPHKPHLPLTASIIGGSLSALGNMANVAQFNLQQYPFITSILKNYWQLDVVAAALIWKETLDWLNAMGLWDHTIFSLKKVGG